MYIFFQHFEISINNYVSYSLWHQNKDFMTYTTDCLGIDHNITLTLTLQPPSTCHTGAPPITNTITWIHRSRASQQYKPSMHERSWDSLTYWSCAGVFDQRGLCHSAPAGKSLRRGPAGHRNSLTAAADHFTQTQNARTMQVTSACPPHTNIVIFTSSMQWHIFQSI